MILQVPIDLFNELGIVGTALVQPEDRRGTGCPRSRHCQLDPVSNGFVLYGRSAPNVPFFYLVFQDRLPGGVNDPDGAVSGGLESLVVGTVLFRFLRHEANVGHTSHGHGVVGAMFFAVLDHFTVKPCVALVGDDSLGVVGLAVGTPHLPAVTDHGGHGGVDDDVAGHVEVGDPMVRVHHGHIRLCLIHGLEIGNDLGFFVFGQLFNSVVQITYTIVEIHTQFGDGIGMLLDGILVVDLDAVAEDDGIGDLHHGGLQVQGEQNAFVLGVCDLLLEELDQRLLAHER